MTVAYYAGFDAARVGPFQITGSDAGGAWSAINITTGTYCHVDITSVTATSGYALLATWLKAQFDAQTGTQVYTVTFDNATGHYTISVDTGTFTLSFPNNSTGARTAKLLGFSGNQSSVSSCTSDQVAYYGIVASVGARTNTSGIYQMMGTTKVAVADDGTPYHAGRLTIPRLMDWRQIFETKAKTFEESVATPDFFTWDLMMAHLATGEPLATYDSNYSKTYVGKVREEGAALAYGDTLQPATGDPNYDAYWDVYLKLHYLGRI